MSWFHVADGLFFRRTDDGAVEIGRGSSFEDVEVIQTVDAFSWCSVISSVCARGEDHLSYEDAKRFHNSLL